MKLLKAGDRISIKKGLLLSGKYGSGTVVSDQLAPDDAVMFVLDGMDFNGAPCVCLRNECIRLTPAALPAERTSR